MNTYILYHKHCLDGLAAAYSFWNCDDFVVTHGLTEDSFLPVQYGSPPPELPPDSDLFIVDFSYEPEVIKELQKRHRSVIVLDHHETALRLEGLPNCHIDTSECGAYLAYKYIWEDFKKERPLGRFDVPIFITYIKDHDLWYHKQPHCKEFIAALRSYPLTLSAWDQIEVFKPCSVTRMIKEGRHILRYQNKLIKRLVKTAYFKNIGSHMVPTVCTSILHSEVCNDLLEKYTAAKFACAYSFSEDIEEKGSFKIKHSLRSRRDGFNVARLAEQYGGGGHPSAAGFCVSRESHLFFKGRP